MVEKIIQSIENFDARNRFYINSAYKTGEFEAVQTYIEHHLEIMDKSEFIGLVDFENNSSPGDQLVKKLMLVRIGFYPDSSDTFAVFDYTIGRELTNYLVVINYNSKGVFDSMTMES